MLPHNRIAAHPDRVLLKEFLEPPVQTQRGLAEHIGVPVQRVNEIVRGRRGVSPETAWLFSEAFGTTPEFWLHLQTNHDLSLNRPKTQIAKLGANRALNSDAAERGASYNQVWDITYKNTQNYISLAHVLSQE